MSAHTCFVSLTPLPSTLPRRILPLRTLRHTPHRSSTRRPATSCAPPPTQTASSTRIPSTDPAPHTQRPVTSRTRIRELHASTSAIGQTHVVKGWVRSVRAQKTHAFIDLNDGSALTGLQVIVDADADAFAAVDGLSTGCSIAVRGEIVASLGKGQNFEMRAAEISVIGEANEYPLQKKRHSLEFLRGIAHLRPRTNAIGAVARVRSTLACATHAFFSGLGFLYVHSPIITASDCEGAGEMFRVTTAIASDGVVKDIPSEEGKVNFREDFFGKAAFLTVSGQLSAESYACALGDVYTFGPTFRAENSNTSRHLAEFWMIEPEMAFADLRDDMANAEAYVKYVVGEVLAKCREDVEFFDRFVAKGLLEKLTTVVDEPFARISYTEAVELLERANKKDRKGRKRFEFDVSWGADLQSEHERYLAEEHFKRPVFVYNYPREIKSFYMLGNEEDGGKTVAAMDLLVPGIGELVGGSARENRLHVLEQRLDEEGLDREAYQWYLDLRRFGSVPHAGYGLGFERLVQFVTGMENIRDVIPFPRYPGSAEF